MTRRARPLTASAAAVAALAVLAACAGGGPAGDDTTGTIAGADRLGTTADPFETDPLTTDASAESPMATDPLATDVPPTPAPSTVPPAAELPVLQFTSSSAGPLQVGASGCSVEGLANATPDAGVESFALDASRAFVPTAEGVAVFGFTPGTGCSLVLDVSAGTGGVLTTADPVDSVAVSATGRLAATGLFGTTVFDLATGSSFACDAATGTVDIAADGSQLLTSFPGSPVELHAVSDTGCAAGTEVVVPTEVSEVRFVAFDGFDLLIGGAGVDGTVYAGRAAGGVLQWKVGNLEVGGPGWIGWVHGMAPCAGGYCIVDTNTDKLVVTDAAGTLRAEFSLTDLLGFRLFHHSLEVGPDGALYLLSGTSVDDGAGGSIEGNYLVRLEVTG